MAYKILIDSCGELTEEMRASGVFENIPLGLSVDDYYIVDDETFDQESYLKKVAESPNVPRSSCPSPERYMQSFVPDAHVYVVTLSSQLSGSYNSAELAKQMYLEDHPDAQIHVFDSKSASIGQSLIGLKVQELEEQGLSFEDIVAQGEAYRDSQQTFFVLETLDTLRKNGRLSNLKAIVASALNIKPICGSTPEGEIQQLGQARGMNKALDKMVDLIAERVEHPEERILMISHVANPERALSVKKKVESRIHFKDIQICNGAGVTSMYANRGGIVVVG